MKEERKMMQIITIYIRETAGAYIISFRSASQIALAICLHKAHAGMAPQCQIK
jgi:hypothetical protein